MNTSTFMDKQIMDLTASNGKTGNSGNSGDFADLVNHHHHPREEEDNNITKEEIEPSYDFQPIRPPVQALSFDGSSGLAGGSRAWNSADSKADTSALKNYGSLDCIEHAKVILPKDAKTHNESILSEIDHTMKKYADGLLHALDGVSARLTQLETRTCNLENSVDDIKVTVGNNHGSTDGKMRQLENILREVQTGVQVLRDKHEIIEAQLELSKLLVSQTGQHTHTDNLNVSEQSSTVPQTKSAPLQEAIVQPLVASAPQQAYQQLPPPATTPSYHMPQNVAPPPIQSQQFQPQAQPSTQTPQNQFPHPTQHDSYYPLPGQTHDASNQHYQLPPPVQQSPPPPNQQPPPPPSSAPVPHYPGPYLYSQPPQQHSSMPPVAAPPQAQPQPQLRQEEAPYMPSKSYAPSPHQPPSHTPSSAASSPQYYAPPQVYDAPPSRSNLGFASGYGAPSGTSEPYPYGGPAQYSGGSKPQQTQSSGSGYPQLPTARVLPQAIPTASAIGVGSGSSGTGNNRVPVDDVVDKVTSMGFSRDQVRATVRRLTENGQAVDLNIVLDKLMNDSDVQPPKGWFGR